MFTMTQVFGISYIVSKKFLVIVVEVLLAA